jgi:DNA replication and repair protein recF
MFLKKITILNYKNISDKTFHFSATINCFTGNNGIGKTNLLDAIYHLAMGKSYFSSNALQNIRHNEEFYLIEGLFESEQRQEQIVCSLKKGQKKVLKHNGKAYERIADHLGKYPMVLISPADRDLITEGSETRRKFLDSVIAQTDREYVELLLRYNRLLLQRNTLLKQMAETGITTTETLYIYDQQLAPIGQLIYQKRSDFMQLYQPQFSKQYSYIAGKAEAVSLHYHSALHHNSLAALLHENYSKDLSAQYTTAGIHKDDLLFEIEGYPIKKYGSQGQQKSFLIALKLSQYELLKQQLQKKPIVLLDDIFDKLDDSRVTQLVQLVTQGHFGQLFITDTHKDRTEAVVQQIGLPYEMIEVKCEPQERQQRTNSKY